MLVWLYLHVHLTLRQDKIHIVRDRQRQKVETDDWKETPVLVGGGSENKQ